jgi:hypothetical protein
MSRTLRRTRLATLWIALSLTTLLGCSRISRLLPQVDGSTGPLSAPSPAVVEETIGTGNRTLHLGPTTDLGSAVIPAGGGAVHIDAPDNPMYGLTLEVPLDAYANEVEVHLSYRSVEGHSLGERFVPRSPLIEVEMTGGYAARTIQLTIPAAIPEEEVPVALTFVPGSGRMEAMRIVAKGASSVTVGGRRIGNVVLTSVDEWFLFEHNFETGFKHGVDSWQFTNWGAYPTPGGNCTGMTMSAIGYYMERRATEGKPPLYGLYDNDDNPFYATPQLEADDRLAIRLVSMVQAQALEIQDSLFREHITQEEFLDLVLSDDVETARPPVEVYDAIVSAMFFTGEPQLVAVRKEEGGHALIAYKKVGSSIYLSDPNHPNAGEGADKLVFDPDTRQFEPYMIGGTPYPKVAHLGATSDWDMTALNGLWDRFDDGTVGEGVFPAYTILYAPPDGTSIPLENNMEIDNDEPQFHVDTNSFVPRVTLYVESAGVPRQVDQAEGSDGVHVDVQPGVNALGFLIEAKSAEGASYVEGPGVRGHAWVDFRWFNVLLQEEEAAPIVEPTATQPAAQWTVEQCNALPELTFSLGEQTLVAFNQAAACASSCQQVIDVTTDYDGSIALRWHRQEYDQRGETPRFDDWFGTSLRAGETQSFYQMEHQPRSEECWQNVTEISAVVAVYGVPECKYLHRGEAFLNGDPTTLGLPVYVPENPCRAERTSSQ